MLLTLRRTAILTVKWGVDITDVLVLKSLDEVGDSLVLRDGRHPMCVEVCLIENVFVGSAEQQHSSTLQLHPHAFTTRVTTSRERTWIFSTKPRDWLDTGFIKIWQPKAVLAATHTHTHTIRAYKTLQISEVKHETKENYRKLDNANKISEFLNDFSGHKMTDIFHQIEAWLRGKSLSSLEANNARRKIGHRLFALTENRIVRDVCHSTTIIRPMQATIHVES